MKRTSKLTALLFAAIMVVATFGGCATTTTAPSAPATPSAAAPTEEVTTAPTEAPTEAPAELSGTITINTQAGPGAPVCHPREVS